MRSSLRAVVFLLSCGLSLVSAWAQVSPCPLRPPAGSPINNPPDLYSQNGTLSLDLALKNGADSNGFMHYCYVYLYQGKQIEAPTLRLNPGDQLVLNLTDSISAPFDRKPMTHMHGTMKACRRKGF